jgi:class 3 adenylate cyclase
VEWPPDIKYAVSPDGTIWISRTVRDLAVGSGIDFQPLGPRSLRGIGEDWELYEVRS